MQPLSCSQISTIMLLGHIWKYLQKELLNFPTSHVHVFRMQDVELMHMRYALESALLALGAMERSTTDGMGDQQMAFYCLKD